MRRCIASVKASTYREAGRCCRPAAKGYRICSWHLAVESKKSKLALEETFNAHGRA